MVVQWKPRGRQPPSSNHQSSGIGWLGMNDWSWVWGGRDGEKEVPGFSCVNFRVVEALPFGSMLD